MFIQEEGTCVFKFVIDKWAEGIAAKISLSERLKLILSSVVKTHLSNRVC